MQEIKFRQKCLDQNGNKTFHYWGFMENGSFVSPIINSEITSLEALENSEPYELYFLR